MNRTIDGLLCAAVFVGAALACGGGSSEQRSATFARAAPSAHLTALELAKAYDSNEVSADRQYKGKVIDVDGVVEKIGKDIMNTPYLTFEIGSSTSVLSVQAMFGEAAEARLAGLTKGKAITVRCRVDGKLINVILRDCVFS